MKKQYHLDEQPIPPGFRIFEERLQVMGVTVHKDSLLAFIRGKGHQLSFELEPQNHVDPNAIKIIGHWKGWLRSHSGHIGYVSKEVAKRIAAAGIADRIQPRLLKTYAGTDDFVEVLFQIVAPADAFDHYSTFSPSAAVRAKAQAKAGNLDEAEAELHVAVNSTERESQTHGYGVAPRPYLELAKLYRKTKRRDDEIAILERYEAQKKAPGALPAQLAERLAKLRKG